jgi:hypothetical protein
MAEYIKREAIMEFPIRKDRCDKEHANEHFIFGIESVLEYVENLPAADVATVVLGHWKKDRDTIKCTVCGFGMFPNRYTFMHGVCVTDNKLPKYCENCGAKMGTTEEQSV